MLYGLKHRDYRTINYTEDLDEAYKFCATHPGYEIIAAEKLKKDIDYNETEFIYRYIVSFNLSMDEKSYVMIKHLENLIKFTLNMEVVEMDLSHIVLHGILELITLNLIAGTVVNEELLLQSVMRD